MRFTIAYQREEISPLQYDGFDAPIQQYLLFEKSYSDIRGALEYRDPKEKGEEYSRKYLNFADTLNGSELTDRGDFVRAFPSMEEAKKYAIEIADIRHRINKKNIIRDIHDSRIEEIVQKNRMKEYDAILRFGKQYSEILNVVSEYEFPHESCSGGAYIISALKEKLGLDEEMVLEMMQYIPTKALLPRYLRKAAELREKGGK